METFCNTWIVSSILVSEMRWFGVDLVDQNRSYHIRVDISIHLTSKFNLDVKTGSLVGYVFRIDDAQADYADYADFPITNIRVVAWFWHVKKHVLSIFESYPLVI